MTAVSEHKTDDEKRKDDVKDNIGLLEAQGEGNPADQSKVSFLTSEDEEARIRLALDRGVFIGFTKDELLRFEKDAGWRRIRLVLLILFWLAWGLLLFAAVVVILLTPPCPHRPSFSWPERFPIYEINVPSFRIGSKCDVKQGTPKGNINGVIDVLDAPGNNYFDRISEANIYWLRGINDLSDPLWSEEDSAPIDDLEELFKKVKKRNRRILLDLLPYKKGSPGKTNAELECGIFSGTRVREATKQAEVTCFTEASEFDNMIAYIEKYRHVANGFVLDYNKALLNSEEEDDGRTYLQKIARAVGTGSESGDNAKHLIMRFPVLDSQYTAAANAELIETRRREEIIARNAGIVVVMETLAMNEEDSAACSTVDCLTKLVDVVQTFSNDSKAHRAFAIDDPNFTSRTYTENSKIWNSVEALAAFTITGLPGTPVIYYGSELGMSSADKSVGQMQWTDLNDNTCPEASSFMCFCNQQCNGKEGVENRTNCPVEPMTNHHLASVREQIRTQSSGPLGSFEQLLTARQHNDSLSWGSSSMILESTTPNAQPILMVMRKAPEFESFGLFVSLGSGGSDKEAVPELPAEIASSCYQTLYTHNNPLVPPSGEKHKFTQLVLQAHEVRLVRIYDTCAACAIRTSLSFSLVFVFLAMLTNQR